MLNLFKRKSRLTSILELIKRNYEKQNCMFNLIIYGSEGSIDLQIFNRINNKISNVDYDDIFGFEIFLFFNKNKPNNSMHYSNFTLNTHFKNFAQTSNKENEIFIYDCKNDIKTVETITIDILSSVYKNNIETARIELYKVKG